MQWFSKYASIIETVFSAWFTLRSYLENNWCYKELRVPLWSVNQRATEAEESPLLRFMPEKVQ
jgi:hypothetical protein